MIKFTSLDAVLISVLFVVFLGFLVVYMATPDKGDLGQWLTFGERAQIFFNYFK